MLRQLRSIRRSVSDSVFHSLVVSLVMPRFDYGNATLAGLPWSQLRRLQSVLNAAARLIHRSSRYEHVTPMLRDLHWLWSPEHIDFKLAVLVYRCLHGLAPRYLSDQTTSSSLLILTAAVCGRRHPRSWRSDVHGCPLSATVRFRWPDAAFGLRSLFFSESPQDTPLLKIISCITFNCFPFLFSTPWT